MGVGRVSVQNGQFGKVLSFFLRLMTRPSSWLALIVVLIAAIFLILASDATRAVVKPDGAAGHMAFAQAVSYATQSAVLFFLARRFGGEKGSAASPKVPLWIALSVVFWLTQTIFPALTLSLFWRIAILSPVALDIVSGVSGLVIHLVLFPVLILLIALAHSGKRVGIRAIWKWIAVDHLSIYLGYAALWVVLVFPGIERVITSQPGLVQETYGSVLLKGFEAAITGMLPLLYAISTYRALATSVPDGARVFD